MSDHQMYAKMHEEKEVEDEYEIFINEKKGDELLIELYRERPFLYDKSNQNYKDIAMRSNAWEEISKIMLEVTEDGIYTAQYCQKRCASLRDQYTKVKRKNVLQPSGSGAAKPVKFAYYSNLMFLDDVIKRRGTYTNCNKAVHIEKLPISNKSICDLGDKENVAPLKKKTKINETKELESTIMQMSRSISDYLENRKTETSCDDSFITYLIAEYKSLPESEKPLRRFKLMEALNAPLNK